MMIFVIFVLSYLGIGLVGTLPLLWSDDEQAQREGAVAVALWPALVVITVGWNVAMWFLHRRMLKRGGKR
jgi:hypothetical protein